MLASLGLPVKFARRVEKPKQQRLVVTDGLFTATPASTGSSVEGRWRRLSLLSLRGATDGRAHVRARGRLRPVPGGATPAQRCRAVPSGSQLAATRAVGLLGQLAPASCLENRKQTSGPSRKLAERGEKEEAEDRKWHSSTSTSRATQGSGFLKPYEQTLCFVFLFFEHCYGKSYII